MDTYTTVVKVKLEKKTAISTSTTKVVKLVTKMKSIPKGEVKVKVKKEIQRRHSNPVSSTTQGSAKSEFKYKHEVKYTDPEPLPKKRRASVSVDVKPHAQRNRSYLPPHRDPNIVGYHPRHLQHRHEHQRRREVDMNAFENGGRDDEDNDDYPEFAQQRNYWN